MEIQVDKKTKESSLQMCRREREDEGKEDRKEGEGKKGKKYYKG